jgi:hypothetical protein
MDPHVPGGPVRSFKDFLVHLGIVTLGILIALGLEQLVEQHRRHRIAEEAVAGFIHELADDREMVQAVLSDADAQHAKIQTAIADLNASQGAETIQYPGIAFNFISSASWDTAFATQALNELPYDEVKVYASAYGALRVFLDQERVVLGLWQSVRRFGEQKSGLSKEQRVMLIEELRRYDSAYDALAKIGASAVRECVTALR